jgi:hypothetical protein
MSSISYDKEFYLNVSEFIFALLFELLWFIDKKLEAFDVIDSRCCMLMTNWIPYAFVLFNQVIIKVRYLSKIYLCTQDMLHMQRNCFVTVVMLQMQ